MSHPSWRPMETEIHSYLNPLEFEIQLKFQDSNPSWYYSSPGFSAPLACSSWERWDIAKVARRQQPRSHPSRPRHWQTRMTGIGPLNNWQNNSIYNSHLPTKIERCHLHLQIFAEIVIELTGVYLLERISTSRCISRHWPNTQIASGGTCALWVPCTGTPRGTRGGTGAASWPKGSAFRSACRV